MIMCLSKERMSDSFLIQRGFQFQHSHLTVHLQSFSLMKSEMRKVQAFCNKKKQYIFQWSWIGHVYHPKCPVQIEPMPQPPPSMHSPIEKHPRVDAMLENQWGLSLLMKQTIVPCRRRSLDWQRSIVPTSLDQWSLRLPSDWTINGENDHWG